MEYFSSNDVNRLMTHGKANDAAAIAGGGAFLVSELTYRDKKLHLPLMSVTYPKHINITVGGGMVEFADALYVLDGLLGGNEGAVLSTGATQGNLAQVDIQMQVWKSIYYEIGTFIKWQDAQRSQMVGRSLDQLYNGTIKRNYAKFMDKNVHIGLTGTQNTGILNDASVPVQANASGQAWVNDSTGEITATSDQMLEDVNAGIIYTWEQCDYDEDAIPDYGLIPYDRYNALITTPMSVVSGSNATTGGISVLEFLQNNNIAKKNGHPFEFGATRYCDAGNFTSNKARMAIYRKDDRFLEINEFLTLARIQTAPAPMYGAGFASIYCANVGTVKLHYKESMSYWEGI